VLVDEPADAGEQVIYPETVLDGLAPLKPAGQFMGLVPPGHI